MRTPHLQMFELYGWHQYFIADPKVPSIAVMI